MIDLGAVISPGPLMIEQWPELFSGATASMYVGNSAWAPPRAEIAGTAMLRRRIVDKH